MADAVTMTFDTTSIDAGLDQLAAGVLQQLRPAAQAGAQALYDEVKVNVGKLGRVTGNLQNSIYQVYSKNHSTDAKAVYQVSWNYKKAPHGHLIENGTSRAPAYPFLRPAYDSKNQDALQAVKARMASGVSQIVAGLKA